MFGFPFSSLKGSPVFDALLMAQVPGLIEEGPQASGGLHEVMVVIPKFGVFVTDRCP